MKRGDLVTVAVSGDYGKAASRAGGAVRFVLGASVRDRFAADQRLSRRPFDPRHGTTGVCQRLARDLGCDDRQSDFGSSGAHRSSDRASR